MKDDEIEKSLRKETMETDEDMHSIISGSSFRKDCPFLPNQKEWSRIARKFDIKDNCVCCDTKQTRFRNKRYMTRRLIHEWFISDLKEEEIIRFTCLTKNCINPLHMITDIKNDHADSVFQMWKNRDNDRGLSQYDKSNRYDLPIHIIKKIDSGKTYKHLRDDISIVKGRISLSITDKSTFEKNNNKNLLESLRILISESNT